MTEKEEIMYEFLTRISSTNAPIIFKGGLITKLVLSENGYNDVQRSTVDIDASWMDTLPSMDEMFQTINNSLGNLRENYFIDIMRECGVRNGVQRSAGFCVYEKDTNEKLFTMDIDIRPSVGFKTYFFGEASIKGVLVDEILADKLITMSNEAIYKHRTKDMVDVYSLAHCTEVGILDILDICKKKNQEIQSFEAFHTKIPEIKHAYDKLRRITGKPDFSEVYAYLKTFIEPFENPQRADLVWNPSKSKWQDKSVREVAEPQKETGATFSSARRKNVEKELEEKNKNKDINKDKNKNKNKNNLEL